MARRVFYSFHYVNDSWRTSQFRNIGVIEGNQSAKDNDWETIKKGGDSAIKKWIDDQLNGRTCTIVLIGSQTAGRKWIDYEIEKSWKEGKGVVGIYINKLKDSNSNQSTQGSNPFLGKFINGVTISNKVKTYNPPYSDSKDVYEYISKNISAWVEEAIRIRQEN